VLADVVREAAARYGERPLYVMPDGSTLDYAGLDIRSDAMAEALAGKGVRAGDVVALLVPSGPSYAVLYAAAAKLGAVTAGVNHRLAPSERRRCIDVADPRVVVADAALAAQSALEARGEGDVIDLATLEAATGSGARPVPPTGDPDRPVAIVFTSGTTGAPRGAVFTEGQLDAVSLVDGGMRWGEGGRGLASTSFSHLGYMTKLPQALRGGGTSFVMTRWSARDALAAVAEHGITMLGGIPTQVALMLRRPEFDDTDTSSVQLIALGGGPATPSLVREARARFGVPVVVRYTCTEAGVGVGTAPGDPPEDAEESVGRARAGVELTIRDEHDSPLPRGETGQVCLRSGAVMARYHRDPEATAAVMTSDGAVRTGDLGRLDDDDRLHLVGRIKEMYVRGGYNVHPQEVERVLADHPAVAQVAVVARPDPVMGEVGVAVVVPADPGRPPSLEDLRRYAGTELAAHKLPEDVMVRADLPRTAMEKVDRRALAEDVARGSPTIAR
jgi:acyl-CoA synthetase (AMP-forming)/AMP-acid ligase II